MTRKKIYEWGRKLDAGEGHDPLLDISRRLSSLQIKSVSTPTGFREALLDNLLSKRETQSASTSQPRRFLTLDVVVAVMTLVLLVGTFVWNMWSPDSTSEPGSAISPLASGVTATPISTAPQPTPAYTPEPFVGSGDDAYVRGLRNATFIGPLEMSIPGGNATAGQGWLELTLGPGGTSITHIRYSLMRANCYSDSGTILNENSGWIYTGSFPDPLFIVDGVFEFDSSSTLNMDSFNGLKVIRGQLTSPTEAIALVEILTRDWSASEGFVMCDFGTWSWSAEAPVPPYSEFNIPRGIPESAFFSPVH